jgi:hypothetical protein
MTSPRILPQPQLQRKRSSRRRRGYFAAPIAEYDTPWYGRLFKLTWRRTIGRPRSSRRRSAETGGRNG